jgi:3-phenylpropionate/trans-cinnamate dioxygenase ferredoxin subunit
MEDPRTIWHRLAGHPDELTWRPNGMMVAEVGGRKVTLAMHQGTIHAFAHLCPHASGVMADGWIDALGNVVCPLHKYRFELQRGRNVSGEGYRLKTYPVRQDAEGLHIGFIQSF